MTSPFSSTCWGKAKRYCISPREMHKRGFKLNPRNMTVYTLDSILKQYSVEHVDYLSLDVEGFETSVLSGYSKCPRLLKDSLRVKFEAAV